MFPNSPHCLGGIAKVARAFAPSQICQEDPWYGAVPTRAIFLEAVELEN